MKLLITVEEIVNEKREWSMNIEIVKCPKCATYGMDVLADKVDEEIICSVCQEAENDYGL